MCSITPSTITVTSGSTGNFTVTVSTTQTVAANLSPRNVAFAGLGLTPLFGLGLLLHRKRRIAGLCCLVLATFILSFGISGCSSNNGSGGSTQTTYRTPAGTYMLTVTVTAGSASTTQNLTLIVN
jgi:hypothetical protein